MIHVAQCELQQLVGQYACCVCKSKQTMICKHCSQAHCSRMNDCLVAEIAETAMSMYNLDLFPDNNVAKDWKEGEDGGKGGLQVYDEERNVIDF
jgi:hypothetical protein